MAPRRTSSIAPRLTLGSFLATSLALLLSVSPALAGEGTARSAELNERGASAVKAGKFTEAEDLFRQALTADSHNLTAAFNLAGMYINNKNPKSAVELLESYTASYGDDAGLWVRLGDARFASRETEKAIPAYEKALALDKEYPGVAAKLATLYSLANRLADSEKMLLEASRLDPKDAQLLANLSSVQLANGNAAEAVASAKRSLQLRPAPETYITLGSAYESLEDRKNSLIAFQRARDLGDTRPELEEKIASLTERRENIDGAE